MITRTFSRAKFAIYQDTLVAEISDLVLDKTPNTIIIDGVLFKYSHDERDREGDLRSINYVSSTGLDGKKKLTIFND